MFQKSELSITLRGLCLFRLQTVLEFLINLKTKVAVVFGVWVTLCNMCALMHTHVTAHVVLAVGGTTLWGFKNIIANKCFHAVVRN